MIDKSNWEIFQSAFSSLSDCIEAVSHEAIEWKESRGRILFEDIVSDRPSPPIDVSAMDGYAIRLSDIGNEPIGVAGTIFAGQPVQPLPLGQAMRVFTGAPVPKEAECVLRREDTEELSNAIRVKSNMAFPNQGENIRKQGENAEQGQTVLQIGSRVTPSAMSAMATFGYPEVDVHRRIRIIIVNTGDELRNIHETVEDWQIRDSNGPCLEMLLANDPTFDLVARVRLPDDLASLRRVLAQWIPEFDAILLTGGVSMGDSDFVPKAIEQAGGRIIFHKIPIRPGKPILGACGPQGQLILGLPGNPVSVLVTARRLGIPLLRKLAGSRDWESHPSLMKIANPDEKTIGLVWFRLVRKIGPGVAELLDSRGSGDIASLSQSDGFVEIPPNEHGPGPWPYYEW